ncbi:hypothetical protein QEG98_30335 [Myxococcus sp. MxC21-1]|uniref:hypothetical protein n=1 Tax=Myxococcus sp. MxC21-1 TaxID=3041439 RepID=UPI00292F17C5|nr:hypothetical protein [Myxococcus sp. MxC21-1]WNZ60271.1 hypothetical protein QEG98_30335 [Myxococcus sp. MxC21-1]
MQGIPVAQLETLSQGEDLLVLGTDGTAVRTGSSHHAGVEPALGLGPAGAGARRAVGESARES